MTDRAEETEKQPAPTLAELLQNVRWDYDSEREDLSPLVPTERFFRDFPWDG